jgi:ribose 5-phosphate isomerase RpiB
MNVLCLGGQVIGSRLALGLVETFLHAHLSGAPRYQGRLAMVHAFENGIPES